MECLSYINIICNYYWKIIILGPMLGNIWRARVHLCSKEYVKRYMLFWSSDKVLLLFCVFYCLGFFKDFRKSETMWVVWNLFYTILTVFLNNNKKILVYILFLCKTNFHAQFLPLRQFCSMEALGSTGFSWATLDYPDRETGLPRAL